MAILDRMPGKVRKDQRRVIPKQRTASANRTELRFSPERLSSALFLGSRTGRARLLAKDEYGVPNGSFFALVKQLAEAEKVRKSAIDSRWEQLQNRSKTSNPYNDQ